MSDSIRPVRHLLGISGGKDSAALAIFMHQNFPGVDMEYYWCDTGKELDETYTLVSNIKTFLGREIEELKGAKGSHHDAPFDHFLEQYGGFIPSSNARWCTKKLKLEPFESFVGNSPVISYVGIRDDEDREGYISKKPNIQSIFPFRRNIWSVDVINYVLKKDQLTKLVSFYADQVEKGLVHARALEVAERPLDMLYSQETKLEDLIGFSKPIFNHAVFHLLRGTKFPIASLDSFPLLDSDDRLVRDDIFRILRESGVGVPEYYEKVPYTINGKTGHYARSRSGCFFCFFQQKIEWVWLLEQHPELFQKAMAYEKDGYQWIQEETLEALSQPDRVAEIKEEFLKKAKKSGEGDSAFLIDRLIAAEGEGCAACFI